MSWCKIWTFMRLAKGLDSTWGKVGKIKGWSFDDPLEPMDDAYGIYRKPSGTYFTNRELVKLFDPALPELPYLYDDFAYSHCDGVEAEAEADGEGASTSLRK
mmetsp:Transcript_7576/g.21663  ORF Transcript_7576/g.21663 Transcript_7576/m.21663 type:complete len:102 (-) Transcript_7576:141-446(-)